jgi:hypothetical protein
MQTYREFKKQAQSEDLEGYTDYIYNQPNTSYAKAMNAFNQLSPGLQGALLNPRKAMLSERNPASLSRGELEELGYTPEQILTINPNAYDDAEPVQEELPEPTPEGPVRTQTNTAGPVKVMAGSTNPNANVEQMAADARSNLENPRTTNGKRYGRNLVGSPYVTLPGYKPGNREKSGQTPSTPTIKQTANTPQPDNLSKNMPESYSQYSSRVVTDKGPGQ